MKKWLKVKIVSTQRNKHRVFAYNSLKWVLLKEFKTLEEAIIFTKKQGGKFIVK